MIKAEQHVVRPEDFRERAAGLRQAGFALLSSLTVNEEDPVFVSVVHSPSLLHCPSFLCRILTLICFFNPGPYGTIWAMALNSSLYISSASHFIIQWC